LFYGWVVVIAFFFVYIIMMGLNTSFGVFFKSLESAFDLTRATTSAIFSGRMALACVFSILGGWALDRYGPRIVLLLMGVFLGLSMLLTGQTNAVWQLFVTYSLFFAMGSGATYVVSSSTLLRWFDKKRGLALGIAGMGGGLGTVIMAPLATYLITDFDWRVAFVVLGLIGWAIVIPASLLLKKDPAEIGELPDGAKSEASAPANELGTASESLQPIEPSLVGTFQTRGFWLYLLIWLSFAFSGFLVLTHIVPHATDIGYSAGQAAAILSLFGGALIVGRLLVGILADRISRRTMAIICSLFQVGIVLWLIWAQELWMLYLFAVVYGFTQGGMTTALTALAGDTFSLSNIGKILGLLDVGFAIGAAIGPVFGGYIFDVNQNYSLAFLIVAVVMLFRTLFIALIRLKTGQSGVQ
jgi:MFS family permease